MKLQETLRAKGYIAEVCETKEEAAAYIDSQIDHRVVGIGGSQTVAQMNLGFVITMPTKTKRM